MEGPSDLLYSNLASNILKNSGKKHLDNKWVITPTGSIDKIASFVTLFGGLGINIAALTDYTKGEKAKIQRLKEIQILKTGHVLTLDTYSNQEEADVEDILGRRFYVDLINNCYSLPTSQQLPIT